MASNAKDNVVIHDFSPLMRQYKTGRVERLMMNDFVPPSLDPLTGVQSKDVGISPQNNVSARIYMPKNDVVMAKKLPLLIYFHGGGFLVGSAFCSMYHTYLNFLVKEANVVAVSVEYRLAPEHPLPVAYEDSSMAIKWAVDQFTDEGDEEWIKSYADSNRVYLGGDSAGGNIAHIMAIRVGTHPELLNGLKIRGVYLNCPFFHGEVPIGDEEISHKVYPKGFLDRLWYYVCPTTKSCDDPWLNPDTDPNLSSFGSERVLVYVCEKDALRGWNWHYKDVLLKSGWSGDIEVVEVKGEDHCFSVVSPTSDNGMAVLKKVALFLNH